MNQSKDTSSSDNIKWLFVFGTLKPGFSQHEWNRKIHNDYYNLTCEKAILKDYALYLNEYPTLIEEKGKHVEGYVLTSEKWKKLLDECDEIEGTPNYYQRIEVLVELPDKQNQVVKAWAYKMNETRYKPEELTYLGSCYK